MKNRKAIGFEFKRMANTVQRHLQARLAREGFDEVTIMHGYIMGYLYRNSDRCIFQKDIESNFEISRSTVTNILKLMEKKGYVTRNSDVEDGRLKHIELTELGKNVQREVIRAIDRFNLDIEAGITEEERETFFRLVAKVRDNIENEEKKGGKVSD